MNKEKDINKRFKLHQTWNWIKHPSTWQCYLPSWLCEVLLELLRHCGMNILFALDSCDPAVVQGGSEIRNQSKKRKMFYLVQEYFSKLCQPTAVIVCSLWLFSIFHLLASEPVLHIDAHQASDEVLRLLGDVIPVGGVKLKLAWNMSQVTFLLIIWSIQFSFEDQLPVWCLAKNSICLATASQQWVIFLGHPIY